MVGCGGDQVGQEPPLLSCAGGQAFADVTFTGVWHLEIAYDPTNRRAVAMRVEQRPEGYEVRMYGTTTTSVRLDDAGMAVELHLPVPEGESPRVMTLSACEMDALGTITGDFQYCIGEDCYPASVTGRKLEVLDEPVAAGMTLISEYGGPDTGEWRQEGAITMNVRVHDNLAYLARDNDGLRIVDLTNPATPIERGHLAVMYPAEEYYNDVKIVQGADARVFALMASNVRGVVVIDVTNPDAPVEVTSFPGAADAPDDVPSVHTLFVEGTRAYLAYTYDSSLRIYDVSEPTQPMPLGRWAHPDLGTEGGYLHDLYVKDGRAYLNYWNLGMVIVDTLADPQNPTFVGAYVDYGERTSHSSWVTTVGEQEIAVHGDEQYNAHVRIVDVDDASATFLDTLGSYQTRPEVSVHNILAHQDLAYVTYYQDGLRVLNLQDPGNPVEIAHYQTWPGFGPDHGFGFFEGAIGIDLDPVTGMIYLVDTHRGLFVLTLDSN